MRILISWAVCGFLFFFCVSVSAENMMNGAKKDEAGHLRIPLQIKEDIRVVYQVSADQLKNKVARALFYGKKLLDTYNDNGIPDEQIDLHLVFHGEAIKALLLERERARLGAAGGSNNPNRELVIELVRRGVSIELCESTMAQNEIESKQLIEGVATIVGAYPRIIELQMSGYAYIRFDQLEINSIQQEGMGYGQYPRY